RRNAISESHQIYPHLPRKIAGSAGYARDTWVGCGIGDGHRSAFAQTRNAVHMDAIHHMDGVGCARGRELQIYHLIGLIDILSARVPGAALVMPGPYLIHA